MNLQEINKAWKKLPPVGSLELYAILHAEDLVKVRRDFNQKLAESIYKAQDQ
jgi:hypothetical protein